jgi:hypothetical protein
MAYKGWLSANGPAPFEQSANLAAQPNLEFWLLNLYKNLRHNLNWTLVKWHLFYKNTLLL